VHVEWDAAEPVTPLGQLPFFIEYLKQGGLFDGWVADCPLSFCSPNAPRKRDVLGLAPFQSAVYKEHSMTTRRILKTAQSRRIGGKRGNESGSRDLAGSPSGGATVSCDGQFRWWHVRNSPIHNPAALVAPILCTYGASFDSLLDQQAVNMQ